MKKGLCVIASLGLAALGCPLWAAGQAPTPNPTPTLTVAHHGPGFPEMRVRMQSRLIARLEKDKRISPEEADTLQADLKSVESRFGLKGRLSLAESKAFRQALLANTNKIRAALHQNGESRPRR